MSNADLIKEMAVLLQIEMSDGLFEACCEVLNENVVVEDFILMFDEIRNEYEH